MNANLFFMRLLILSLFSITALAFSAESINEKFIRYQNEAALNQTTKKPSSMGTSTPTNNASSLSEKTIQKPHWTLGYANYLPNQTIGIIPKNNVHSIFLFGRHIEENAVYFFGLPFYNIGSMAIDFTIGEVPFSSLQTFLTGKGLLTVDRMSLLGLRTTLYYCFSKTNSIPNGLFFAPEAGLSILGNNQTESLLFCFSIGNKIGWMLNLSEDLHIELAGRISTSLAFLSFISGSANLALAAGYDTGVYTGISYSF